MLQADHGCDFNFFAPSPGRGRAPYATVPPFISRIAVPGLSSATGDNSPGIGLAGFAPVAAA